MLNNINSDIRLFLCANQIRLNSLLKFLLALVAGINMSIMALAQTDEMPVFSNDSLMAFIEKGGDFIYNQEYDSAAFYINQIKAAYPEHPIAYMMEAMNIAWMDQPIRTTSTHFEKHLKVLNVCLEKAEAMREEDEFNKEGVFFEMSVHGLLAEYYAREGSYMKAMGEARKTYSLIKKTMEWTDASPEFYFLAGLYNYFREKYPERHPVYKPFMWFFRSGDMKLGLEQLDSAVYRSKVVKIEAHLYTAYIYLRYENDPERAQVYINRLRERYPNNDYFKAKWLESEVMLTGFENVLPVIYELKEEEDPYYRMCGYAYHGIYYETIAKSSFDAKLMYEAAVKSGLECPEKGEYYRSLAFLGLGRLAESEGNKNLAVYYYETALGIDENDKVTKEAKRRLKGLKE